MWIESNEHCALSLHGGFSRFKKMCTMLSLTFGFVFFLLTHFFKVGDGCVTANVFLDIFLYIRHVVFISCILVWIMEWNKDKYTPFILYKFRNWCSIRYGIVPSMLWRVMRNFSLTPGKIADIIVFIPYYCCVVLELRDLRQEGLKKRGPWTVLDRRP